MTNYYVKGPKIKGDMHIIYCSFFTPNTDKCVLCGEPAVGKIGNKKICSEKCAKELVYDEFEKLVEDLR